MTVSASEVKELRKISGAGMMECKSALTEADGNLEIAFKLLREKGIAKAEKKSSRDANEGLIGIKVKDDVAAIVEINSETDFVSRNAEFHNLVSEILRLSLENIDDKETLNLESSEYINQAVGKIGENIVLKRVEFLKGNIFSYIHNSVGDGLGKIGVLISLNVNIDSLDEVGKNLCMHIAATSPKSVSLNDLDKKIIDAEREIIKQQIKDTGKPENILEKMVDGKLNKYLEEIILLKQKYVIDPNLSVEEYLRHVSDELGTEILIKEFIRFEIGS